MTGPARAIEYRDAIYELLPQVYRARDERNELRRFLLLLGHELDRVGSNIDQLWRDFYIDSCQEWVIPYLADLVGTDVIFNEGARNRADVKNTIGWRRQKGTLGGLEDVAAVITGWGALSAEMFERLVWSQNLRHLRRSAVHAVNLADASKVARVDTAFDAACYSVDLRPPGFSEGLHQVRNVVFYLWGIPSHPWKGATPSRLDSHRYRFHPLGVDCALYAGGDKRDACGATVAPAAASADICRGHTDDIPIRLRDFHDYPLRYFGQPSGFTVYEDGIALCATAAAVESRSSTPSVDFADLAGVNGILVADPGLFGMAPPAFRISAMRLASKTVVVNGQPVPVSYLPTRTFDGNFVVDGSQGNLDTSTFTFGAGTPFQPGPPGHHQRVLLLRIERLGAAASFPECELILRNNRGTRLLVFLPALTGFAPGQTRHLYVADDGSTYFARDAHDAGLPDLNPDSARFGAYLPRHLARAALGQVRPRPGIRPVAHRRAVSRDLCCWDQPLQKPPSAGEVAVDVSRGRFQFPTTETPTGAVTVDFRFAITGEVGAGPFVRGGSPQATIVVSKQADGSHQTIQSAINAAPAGLTTPVVIEIRDSATYVEALLIDKNMPGGLILQSAPVESGQLATPVVQSPGGPVITIAAAAAISRLTIAGLVLSGGDVSVLGAVSDLSVRFCTLDPNSVKVQVAPAAAGARVEMSHAMAGLITASANVATLRIADTVVHHPAVTLEHPEAQTAITAAHAVQLDRATVLGAITAGRVVASNSILLGPATITDPASSCLRYSRFHGSPGTVPTFRCTAIVPVFVSMRFGAAGYAHLHPNSSPDIRTGGEERGEMGAFYSAGIPWREQNLGLKLGEYLPAGLQAARVRVLPVARFVGAIRL